MYLFIYLFILFFLFQKDSSFFNMFYNENNCPALPCFELALLEDNGQENNGMPCLALHCFELALLEDNDQEDNDQ
jgi:hypothetical protein